MDQQQLFTIQQLSLKLKIPKPTLRFWEKELEGIIVPLRTQGGQRRYTAEHIPILKGIKHLRRRGISLDEINRKLGDSSKSNREHPNSSRIDSLANRIADVVKLEVYSFMQKQGLR